MISVVLPRTADCSADGRATQLPHQPAHDTHLGKRSRQLRERREGSQASAQRAAQVLHEARRLHLAGQLLAAESRYLQLLQRQPDHAETHHLLGVLSLQAGRVPEAIARISRALELDPANAEAHANLGSALLSSKQATSALRHYDRALALNPRLIGVHHNRAQALQLLERHDEAAEAFAKLLAASPAAAFGVGDWFDARRQGCDWREFEELRLRCTDLIRSGQPADRPFSFLAVSDNGADQLQCARTYAGAIPMAAPLWTGEQYQHARLRVAYLSADFRDHIVPHLMAPVFEQHDRQRFETFAVAVAGTDDSAVVARTQLAIEHFLDLGACSDAQIATRLRELEIDVAVDLTGHTRGGRPAILARRPAPAQATYLGYPGTLGAPYIDYILADEYVIPAGSEHFYQEQVVWLPGCFQACGTRVALPDTPPTRSALGLPDTGIVYCCFNSSYKLNPRMFDVWMRLLKATPGSTLWLLAGDERSKDRLCAEALRRGVPAERLLFAPRVSYAEHLSRLSCADLFLDTLPFNAGATAGDALWGGVPVLTCSGGTFAARMAGSLLRSLGLDELITDSLEQYEQRALELSADPERLRTYRSHLTALHATAALFDSGRLCRALEGAYLQMRERTSRGDAPHGFRGTSLNCAAD